MHEYITQDENKPEIVGLCMTLDCTIFFSGDISGNVKIWDLKEQKMEKEFGSNPDIEGAKTMGGTKDGILLFFGVKNKIKQFVVETGQVIKSYNVSSGVVNCLIVTRT